MSPEHLIRNGWIDGEALDPLPHFQSHRVNYGAVTSFKEMVLDKAFETFKEKGVADDYGEFCHKNAHWLNDYALFTSLKFRFQGKPWSEWPPDLRNRQHQALQQASNELQNSMERIFYYQYIIFKQWMTLKNYCNGKGVKIIGDMPIYVVYDSADVWVHPELFNLDEQKRPITVAGVPPDYFSETGQLWGNPVYKWDAIEAQDYNWWIQRIAHNIELYDFVRVDHFRGFVGYWEIPASEENAINGRWIEAPAWDFFNRITREFPKLPIIAEDLGVITPDVVEVIRHFGFPGMKILLFAFGDDLPSNPYAPHNVERNCLIYTGTHDNNTARGWFEKETTPEVKKRICIYAGKKVSAESIGRELIRLAMMSVADTAIFPIQDLLGLGEDSRMNKPATHKSNWEWRLDPELLTPSVADELRIMTQIYGRG